MFKVFLTTKVELLDSIDLNFRYIVNATFRFFNQLTTYTLCNITKSLEFFGFFFLNKITCTCRIFETP
jgi:hypothetical protein